MRFFLVFLLSYLIGSISGSYLIGKIFLNKDVREYGSGNAGTTNALRVFGKKWGILTFLIDCLKGVVVTLICTYLLKLKMPEVLSCIFIAVMGHDFPFYMNFKGGKGVATTLGAFMVLEPLLTLICLFVWLITTAITRYVSVGSIVLYVSFSVIFILYGNFDVYSKILVVSITLLGIFKHKSNIKRIVNKSESKIGDKG